MFILSWSAHLWTILLVTCELLVIDGQSQLLDVGFFLPSVSEGGFSSTMLPSSDARKLLVEITAAWKWASCVEWTYDAFPKRSLMSISWAAPDNADHFILFETFFSFGCPDTILSGSHPTSLTFLLSLLLSSFFVSCAKSIELVGWHHRCNGHELGQTLGDGEGQGGLPCCSPWGHRVGHDLATQCHQQQWRLSPGLHPVLFPSNPFLKFFQSGLIFLITQSYHLTLLPKTPWKKKKKVKCLPLSHVCLFATTWTVACQAPLPWNFPGKNTGVGCRPLHQGSSWARGRTRISCIAGRLPLGPAGKPRHVCVAPIACRWPSRSAHEVSSAGSWPCRLVFGCFLAEPRIPEQVPSALWTQHAVTQVCVLPTPLLRRETRSFPWSRDHSSSFETHQVTSPHCLPGLRFSGMGDHPLVSAAITASQAAQVSHRRNRITDNILDARFPNIENNIQL